MSRDTPELVLVHGLAKKPAPDKLEELWLWGLDVDNPKPEVFGLKNPGIGTATKVKIGIPYWADVFYTDYETEFASYYESGNHPERVEGIARTEGDAEDLPAPKTVEGQAFVDQMMAQFAGEEGLADGAAPPAKPAQTPFERVPLPGFLKKRILKQFATESYYFLYEKPFVRSDGERCEMRRGLRKRLVDKLNAARDRSDVVVIVAHSMGTMIAYDCLRNDPDCPEIAGLITLGSPLGVDEIQEPLIPNRDRTKAFPERLKGPWVNVYDPLDPVCALDPRLANDFLRNGAPAIRDIHESNWGDWRHTITHYLAGPQLRAAVRELADL